MKSFTILLACLAFAALSQFSAASETSDSATSAALSTDSASGPAAATQASPESSELPESEQPAKAADDSLFKALGGETGLRALARALADTYAADTRINALFVNANKEYFSERLFEDLCVRSGGPCVYKGLSMESVHSGMDIKPSEFNYFVEDSQKTMDALGIATGTQNRLLKLLARTRGEIIRK